MLGDTLTGKPVLDTLTLVAGGLVALGIVAKAVRTAMRFFQRLEKALTQVESQLYPNSGTSLRDAVNRIQTRLDIKDIPGADREH